MSDYVGNCMLLRICRLIVDCSAVHAVTFSQWICKPDSAGNRMLLHICNGALEPCFCGFCMQLHFCNSFISLKNTIKILKKYQCLSDAILCHHCKFQIFPSLDSLFMQYRVNCQETSHGAILQWRPHDRSWSRFGMIPDCDGRSDGQTVRQTDRIYHS